MGGFAGGLAKYRSLVFIPRLSASDVLPARAEGASSVTSRLSAAETRGEKARKKRRMQRHSRESPTLKETEVGR